MKIGFIGFGKMGSALASGALQSRALNKKDVTFLDPSPQAGRAGRKLGLKRLLSLLEITLRSDVLFLCVKPQQMNQALEGIRPALMLRKKMPVFVSIAAGVTSKGILKGLRRIVPVIRVMPNTPALLGAGMSGVSVGRNVPKAQAKTVLKVLNSVGKVLSAPEGKMDGITAVSGSGPAYVFLLAEALTEAARKEGFPESVARSLAHQTIFGAGKMLVERGEPASTLRKNVTSPGGTTEAALKIFEKKKFKQIVRDAVKAASKRSKQLGKN